LTVVFTDRFDDLSANRRRRPRFISDGYAQMTGHSEAIPVKSASRKFALVQHLLGLPAINAVV